MLHCQKRATFCPQCSWVTVLLFCTLSKIEKKSQCWAWGRYYPRGVPMKMSMKYSKIDKCLQCKKKSRHLMHFRNILRSLLLWWQEAFLKVIKLKYQHGFNERILKQDSKVLESSSLSRHWSLISLHVSFPIRWELYLFCTIHLFAVIGWKYI